MKLNKRGASIVVACLLSAPLAAAQAADISSARVWADSSHTRVVLVLAGPLDYRITQTGGQMLVDLGDSKLAAGFSSPAAQGLYRGLTPSQLGNRLQLRAAIDPASRMRSFVLKPTSGSEYRLVIDLYPAAGKPALASAPVVAPTRRAASEVVASAPSPAPRSTPATAEFTPAPAPTVASRAVVSTPAPRQSVVPVVETESIQPEIAAPPAPRTTVAAAPLLAEIDVAAGRSRSRMVASNQAAVLLDGQRKVVVAIDAGHGGKDPGSHGASGTQEKDVTLAVARELAAQINRQPGMKAVLTRDGDLFIPLKQRYKIARDNSADLFVSIHADSFTNSDARGSSVWVLSPRGKTTMAARWLADGQNRADLIGGVTLDDKDDGLAKVLLDLQQGYAMQASDAVAGNVLKALRGLGPTHRSYVERANFVVLRSPDVPSILVETAFISNPLEEKKLRDPAHQRLLASAVMGGVRDYFESTPPQGSWFAAQAAQRSGTLAAQARPAATLVQLAAAPARSSGKPANSTSRPAAASVSDRHTVNRGESLRSIARQYGISVGVLKNANSMRNDTVRAGATLTIPAT